MYKSNTARQKLYILCCLSTRPQNGGRGGFAYSRAGQALIKNFGRRERRLSADRKGKETSAGNFRGVVLPRSQKPDPISPYSLSRPSFIEFGLQGKLVKMSKSFTTYPLSDQNALKIISTWSTHATE